MPRNDLKAYTTVLARIPQDLADEVKRYASLHRCSVSELIRDGLEMRLEAAIPGRSTGSSTDHGEEVLHEVGQVLPKVLPTLSPMPHTAVEGTLRQDITEVLHEVLPLYVSRQQGHWRGMTEVVPQASTAAPQGHEGMTTVVPSHAEVLPSQVTIPGQNQNGMTEVVHDITEVIPRNTGADFDPTKFYLGKLCPQGHDYQGTGLSLLRRHNGHCRDCENQAKRAKRAARRTAAGGRG